MKIKGIVITTVLILAFITISTTTAAAVACDGGDICVNETGWWRDGGAFNTSTTPIQAAVDNATAGETICVKAGSYTENVNVNKRLTLAGDGADVMNVTAASTSDHVFNVTADYVNISGFNVNGATGWVWKAGIYLSSVDHCNISYNNCSNNNNGIYLSSLSNNNTLTSNTANSNNLYGIHLHYSSNNTLTSNNASNNDYGIGLYSSSNYNTLTSNNASNNNHGIVLSSSSNNTLTNTTVNSNNDYGIGLYSSSNNTLTNTTVNSNNNHGICLYRSSNNTFTSNNASNNYCGIHLGYSSNNTLTSNNASNNNHGICLYRSSNDNLVYNNYFNNCRGIYLYYSSSNTLMSNTMSGNTNNFYISGSSLSEYTHNIDTSNTVDGKPIYYWVDQKDKQIPSDAGFVGVVNGTNITVSDLTLTNNSHGVLCAYTDNSRIENVTASLNSYGIRLDDSSNNTLTSNTANSNNYKGICLDRSSSNTLTSNNASNNDDGICLDRSSNNTLTSNNASNNYNGICLDRSSSNNMLTSNNASNNNYNGICLYRSSNDNMLTSNNASNNNYKGICLYRSSSNTLTSNTANSNNDYGIYLDRSSNDNLVYNNYFNNTKNAYDYGNNQWNIIKTSGTNIIGKPFLGGNYWSDYAGNDNDWDGLGDTMLPYNSSGNIQKGGDYHPLVVPTDTTPPVITITMPPHYELYIVGMTLDFSATDDKSGVDTIVGNLTNTSRVSQIVNSGFAPAVGVYTLVVTATDNASNTNESDPVFFVVYDPDGGHAIGSGWFYPDDDSPLPDGKANFRFTAKYKDNSSTGKLSFQYKDADINFKSMSIDWMMINSVSAQFQGTGTINGEGLYTFRVQAKDNGEPGVDVDYFDINIWSGTDTEADPYHKAKNTISGGNIQVHTK